MLIEWYKWAWRKKIYDQALSLTSTFSKPWQLVRWLTGMTRWLLRGEKGSILHWVEQILADKTYGKLAKDATISGTCPDQRQ